MRIALRWSAVAGLAVALVLSGTTAAVAKPSSTIDKNGNITAVARTSDGRAITNESIAKEVADYWTPERMAAAVDLDFVRPAGSSEPARQLPTPTGPAGTVAPATPSISLSDDIGIQLNESLAVGKVYFSTPWGGASCSASTVASGKRRLVMTAGHCVHQGGGGQWYSNWQFVPRYRSGARPFGTFVAYTLTTRTAWAYNSSYSEDMGIAIMHNGGNWGLKVVDTVGGHGMRWNWGYSVYVTALGYPSNLGGGEIQYYCQSGTWYAHDQVIRMWCNMTYGSSGGPWLQEYNDQNGYGYINSVVSHGDSPGNGQFDGPYFDDDIKSLYDFAEGLSPA